jgi:hypothetical protein
MRKKLQPIVSFTTETEFSGKKEDFLSHDKNKADMIALISTALTNRGCNVIQLPGDTDVDIVKATVERSRHCTTTLVGKGYRFADLAPSLLRSRFRET